MGHFGKKALKTVMVTYSTNINNHLSLQIIEYKKKTMTHSIWNPGPVLRYMLNNVAAVLNRLMWSQPSSSW
jgi:hypothetical protein